MCREQGMPGPGKVWQDGAIGSFAASGRGEEPAPPEQGGRAKVQDNEGKRPADLGASRATPRGEMTALLRRHEMLVLG